MQEFRNIYSIVTSWQPTDVEKENLQDMVSKLIFTIWKPNTKHTHLSVCRARNGWIHALSCQGGVKGIRRT